MKLISMNLDKTKNLIKKVENSKISLFYSITTFFFAITLRNFLEIFSSHGKIFFEAFSHFYASYTFLAIVLIILFYFATKERIKKISRVILPSFLILNLVPVLDIILSFGRGYHIGYITPGLLKFFTFFGPFNEMTVTPGIRIEIALVVFGAFIYFFIKNRDILKSLFFSFLTYSLLFAYCSMPFFVQLLFNAFGLEYEFSHIIMRNSYLLLILIFGTFLLYLYNKNYFSEILRDVRPLRLLHFELMFVLGVVLALILSPSTIKLTQNALFQWIFIITSIVFAWMFSVVTNNFADYKIDKITNKKRPFITEKIPIDKYKKISWILFLLAMVYSSAVSFTVLFLIFLFIGNYFIYSMRPLRLKKVLFFSKLSISLNSLVLFMLGYSFITGRIGFPNSIVVFFLIFFTAAVNFIDIKDYFGDKKADIKTLPVIFGLRRSKIIIGFFVLISYLVQYKIYDDSNLLLPSLTFGLVQFFLINKKKYEEKYVFMVYLSSLIILIFYLLMFKI